MGVSEVMGLTGGVISILMGFLSPVEGAGLHPTAQSRGPDSCGVALFSPITWSTGGFVVVCD